MLHFDPVHFAARRQRLYHKMGEDAVAIFVAPPEVTKSEDTTYKYRPSSNIVYLTGFEEPETIVVLAPGHDDGDFFMFVRNRDPLREQWDGRRYGMEGAEKVFAADKAFPVNKIDEILPTLLKGRKKLYYTLGANRPFDKKVANLMNKLRYQRYSASAAPQAILDARDLINPERRIKHPEELDLMRRSCEISSRAHEAAMKYTHPGVWEYQLEAILTAIFRMEGASGHAYDPIVGTGDNATILHYIENSSQCKDGEVVMIDAGSAYDYYCADISRSWPVNGKFTPEQADVYDIVLDCNKKCIDRIRKGIVYNDVKRYAVELLTEGLVQLGILKGSVSSLIEQRSYMRYYPHSIGHFLGVDVHDVGSYFDADDTGYKLEPGAVVTIEPGLYFPENDESIPEGFRGLGIRIEDDIVCTEGEPENLTASCTKEREAVEALVGTKRTWEW